MASVIARLLTLATRRRDVPGDRISALSAEIADLQTILGELPAEEGKLQSAMAARPAARDEMLLSDAPRREIDQHDRETAALADQMAAIRLFSQQQRRRIVTLTAERDQLRVTREIEKWQVAAAKLLNSMTVACADFEALLAQTDNVRSCGMEHSFIGHCPPPPQMLARDLLGAWAAQVARAAPGWKPAEIAAHATQPAPAVLAAPATSPALAAPVVLAAPVAPPAPRQPDPVPALLLNPPAADADGRVAVLVVRGGLEDDFGCAMPAGRIVAIDAARAYAAVRNGAADFAPVPPAAAASDAAAPAAAAIVEEVTQ